MKFRQADTSDLPFITEVYNQAVESRISTADTKTVDLSYFEDRINKANPRRPLWIIEENGVKAGWASFRDFYGRPAYSGTAEISIYILKDQQNKGLGSRTLEALIQASRDLGIHTLLGFIFSNNEASMYLVKKAGFEQWGFLPDVAEIDGHPLSLSIMGKRIPKNQ